VAKLEAKHRARVAQIASGLKPEAYKKGAVNLDEKKKPAGEEQISQEASQEIDTLTKHLSAVDVKKFKKLVPVDFEKDDDTNHHIDWITAATNMRSNNYHIEESKTSSVRMTAGRIIPAIATTTACITGFVQLEVFKYLLGAKFDNYRGAEIDLGANTFVMSGLSDPRMRRDFKEQVEDEE